MPPEGRTISSGIRRALGGAKLRRAQHLLALSERPRVEGLRHTNRGADEAAVIDRALTLLVE
jgi:hypothetical protein